MVGLSSLLTQQGINKTLRLIQNFVVSVRIVGLRTKHRLLAVGCVNRRTQPTRVGHDVDVIPSVVMSLISHANRAVKKDRGKAMTRLRREQGKNHPGMINSAGDCRRPPPASRPETRWGDDAGERAVIVPYRLNEGPAYRQWRTILPLASVF